MSQNQFGPIIQVKENKIAFYSEECCGRTLLCQYTNREYPAQRCSLHNKEFMKWKRIKKTKKKFRSRFNYRRHRFIKMITFGLPGEKITSNKKTGKFKLQKGFTISRNDTLGYSESKSPLFEYHDKYEFGDDHIEWRNELRKRFNKLRRDPWWKNHVDGGIWFYETVLTELDNKFQEKLTPGSVEEQFDIRMKIHPHFHCMILSPKNLAGKKKNFSELNYLFKKYKLGKPSVSVAKDKDGNTVNASVKAALWYLTNYLKKQEHAEGVNRGSFGIFNKKKK